MIDLKNAKEVKKKVEEIKSKRKINTKTAPKKVAKKETKKQKEVKRKFRKFLLKFILIEYIVCAGIVMILEYNSLLVENEIKDLTIKSQQQTIEKLLNSTSLNVLETSDIVTDEVVNRQYLGKFKITHYCACTKCCGKNACGITASGKPVEENKTIAVDPSVIKLGSQVYIDGYGYMEAQDTGSAIKGNIIDVYIPDHQEALKLGVVYKDVYLVK